MRQALVSCVTAALLAACMMGPDYSRPNVDTAAAFRFEPAEVAKTADTEWWREFGDPVLDALIAEALANNLSVKIAAANVEQAAGVFTQTRSQLFPQVGYSASGARTRASEAGENPDAQQFSMHSYGAQFAEVRVNVETGEVRVPRLLGVFAVGRVDPPAEGR